MKASEPAHWLLIGNSRWHWAWGEPDALVCRSQPPPDPGAEASLGLGEVLSALCAWAAVGPVPPVPGLDPRRRILLSRVPLQGMPHWLGIDRALVGWQAWRRSGSAVLVADAGTALSLTLVDAEGRFVGGRIQAGLALQLRALARGTAGLPALPVDAGSEPGWTGADPWPSATADAMVTGVREGLVASVRHAWRQARQRHGDCRLWITGGDGGWIADRLEGAHRPDLALQALACLAQEAELSSIPDQ
ncbi:type III pantothenate kinase [Cyanobium sp. CH-040]|uniref:type III pantothenate kinase n=1 Tax=Cyanobium sp. CH-040 TaxID=2823708 RepID=UPI0020CFAFE6|nr:type III pantothenate kinase [Cyanobium sp. CH-040]MCP9927244.1 type III pantothenate kinase [Cyanobium sp. CH-040]